MNLRHLETFHYFCKFMSMTKAAAFLHISQPAVSQQLRSFEEECGVKLFYRDSNQYRLTATGEAIFLVSNRVFSRIEQIISLLHKARKASAERLWIGTTKAYARTIMPDLISHFQRKFPLVQVRFSEGNSADLLNRLRTRKEDVVVVARTEYDATLRAVPFAKAQFVLIASPDHALAQSRAIGIASLDGEPLIIREQGSGSRNAILKKLGDYGVTPSVVIESESLSFILAYIERRMGISFILSHEIESELDKGTVRKIDLIEGDISFDADIVTRRGEPMSMPMRYFLKIAKQKRPRFRIREPVSEITADF
ncbi:MAG: LysR family transcriptional regulator [Desulfomonilaceae bacterium]|nr:LysR family transcriptional regulator [Desulfomonilaceae bacterium]